LDGTGFENEHIGQIQIPVDTGRGDVGLMRGVPFLGVDEAEGPPGEPDEMVGFRCNVIFGEDLRKPACWKISIYILKQLPMEMTDVELDPINIFQVYRDRIFTWVVIINITSAVRGEICAAILVVRYLVFTATV
jgi:hypothetical protein